MAMAPMIIMAATSLASAAAKDSQSKIEMGQAETAAQTEELRMLQREGDRKDRLASALATQNAMSGARGVAAFEGSPLAILEDSIRREETATERDRFSTELDALAIRSGAKIRHKLNRVTNQLQLARTASSAMSSGFGGQGG